MIKKKHWYMIAGFSATMLVLEMALGGKLGGTAQGTALNFITFPSQDFPV